MNDDPMIPFEFAEHNRAEDEMNQFEVLRQITATHVKDHAHCPRYTYYNFCLPDTRPRTYLMDAGREAHERERERARRRTLRMYGLPEGERHFAVHLASPALGMTGQLDELVITPQAEYLPVDYKLSSRVNESFTAQIVAYALLIEAQFNTTVRTGYIYLIIPRTLHPVAITQEKRSEVHALLAEIRAVRIGEKMPPPTHVRARCHDCEFRRFCNDV